jgi:RNA polymerase sigma factor (sigma-70 family)
MKRHLDLVRHSEKTWEFWIRIMTGTLYHSKGLPWEWIGMPENSHLRRFFQQIRRVAAARTNSPVADAELLERFVQQHDQAAFELLVWRHEKMVLGVCQRVLQHTQDAQDAFQVTFLALARKASGISRRESIAAWLYKVAYRAALAARANRARRSAHETFVRMMAVPPESGKDEIALAGNEVCRVLDEEVMRLPERYRVPVVLFYLQGKAYGEVARQLRCPVGTVSSRLTRARDLLRSRLVRRGITLPAGLFAGVLSQHAAQAAVPADLVHGTLQAALSTTPAAVSAQVALLTEGVLKSMIATKVKSVLAMALVLCAVTAGAGALAAVSWSQSDDGNKQVAATDKKAGAGNPDPAVLRAQSAANLKKLANAMHQYLDVNERFPPVASQSRDGKPLLSWRVLLLPYLGEKSLFKEFHLDEPWDSAHNKKLLEKMPAVYAPVGGSPKEAHATYYQVFAGTGTMFDDPRGVRIRDIADGTVLTAMLVEGAAPVPWTRPADLEYASDKALPKLGGLFKEGFHLVTADGFVRFLKRQTNEKLIRALITRADGELIDGNELNAK